MTKPQARLVRTFTSGTGAPLGRYPADARSRRFALFVRARRAYQEMSKYNQRPRIMVCEDEPLIALNLIAIIEECGCEPIGPFATGKEALARLRKQRIDAAFLDVDLADGASTPLARVLRAKGRAVAGDLRA
jgi:hypothetical protein